MSASGAKAALQGFRCQALYILNTVLTSEDTSFSFQPEGKEDLDVYQDEKLIYSIQVKSHTTNLKYSEFNPSSPNSFFRRSIETINNTTAQVIIATFGPIGPELCKGWNRTQNKTPSLRNKFITDGYTQREFDTIIENITWEKIDERHLKDNVYNFLQKTLVGGAPSTAFDLLTYWIYRASENSNFISYQDIIEKIQTIGLYLEQRAAHHEEWFTSIQPILEQNTEDLDLKVIESNFYEGISVNYNHILSNLDVIRTEHLSKIEKAYQKGKQVVIIHGASGQGKSALAYRYLHDHVPADWRFCINHVDDRKHAAKIALAISEHHSAMGVPTYIYIDVRPSDSDWPELVKLLVEKKNMHILVTIREEDLARSSAPQEDLGFPEFVELILEKYEAESIFNNLTTRGISTAYPTFNEAWIRFGEHGPLLEFIFLITQNESLQERIKNQVQQLQEKLRTNQISPEELNLLRICAVATAYEAQVKIKEICKSVCLNAPVATLRLFEKEYLLRLSSDNKTITSLHPLRSEKLAQELCDDIFNPWSAAATEAVKCISEDSLEGFLLYSFARHHNQSSTLITQLYASPPKSCVGITGVARALLWLGIKDYVDENSQLFKEAHELFGKGWYFFLDFDLTGQINLTKDLETLFKSVKPDLIEKCQNLRERQTPKERTFKYLEEWLRSLCFLQAPNQPADWQAMAELTFWFGFLKTKNNYYLSQLKKLNFGDSLKELPLKSLCELVYALKTIANKTSSDLSTDIWDETNAKFKRELLVINIVINKENIKAHYIVDDEKLASKDLNTVLHDETIKRVELLALLYPEKSAYGAQGYGHRHRIADTKHDPTTKDCIAAKHLRPSWLSQVNPTFLNLVEWDLRPATWNEYADSSFKIRKEIFSVLKKIEKELTRYFKKRRPEDISRRIDTSIWDKLNSQSIDYPLLPRFAVDEWGKVSETKTMSAPKKELGLIQHPTPILASATIDNYKKLIKPINGYINACQNFIAHAQHPLLFNCFTARIKDKIQKKIIQEELTKNGITNKNSHISAINLADAKKELTKYQSAFQEIVGQTSINNELDPLKNKETKLFDSLCPMWYQLLYSPEPTINCANVQCRIKFNKLLQKIKQKIESSFSTNENAKLCTFIESDINYQGEKTFWIAINVNKHMDLLTEPNLIGKIFGSTFTQIKFNTYEYHALSFLFKQIIIIPHINNHTLSTYAIRIPLNVLISTEDDPPINTLLYGHELETGTITSLGLRTMTSPTLEFAYNTNQLVSKLYVIVEHLGDLLNIPDNIDDTSSQILNKYAHSKSTKIQSIIDSYAYFVNENELKQHVRKKNSPEMNDAITFICDVFQTMMPKSNSQNNFTLEQEEILEWAERLIDASAKISIAQWHILKAEVG